MGGTECIFKGRTCTISARIKLQIINKYLYITVLVLVNLIVVTRSLWGRNKREHYLIEDETCSHNTMKLVYLIPSLAIRKSGESLVFFLM